MDAIQQQQKDDEKLITQQSQVSFQINNFRVLYLAFFFRLTQIQKVLFLSFMAVCIFPVSESSYILAVYKEKSQLNHMLFISLWFTYIYLNK